LFTQSIWQLGKSLITNVLKFGILPLKIIYINFNELKVGIGFLFIFSKFY